MENQQFKTLHAVTLSTAASTSDQFHPDTCPPETAARRAGVLLGCYRKGEAAAPEVYVAAVTSILTLYPQQVAYRVTDPRSGLPGRCQWLPTVAEVKAACEAEMPRPSRRDSLPPDVSPHDRKAAVERIKQRHPALFAAGKKGDAQRLFDEEELRARMSQPLTVSDAFKAHIKPKDELSEEMDG